MRSSNKSRSRNKSPNRRSSTGNVTNRVFDSAGPEGKVRGTPQQIIEKYRSLAHDSLLSGDRVAAENFQQHAEHYARILMKSQKQQAERQAEQQAQQQAQQEKQAERQSQQKPKDSETESQVAEPAKVDRQPDVAAGSFETISDDVGEADSNLVETPEDKKAKAPRKKASAKMMPEMPETETPAAE